jgi:hypothetical protein
MEHISKERMLEIAAAATAEQRSALDRKYFSAEESNHLHECPECVEAFANIVREIIRNTEADRDTTP